MEPGEYEALFLHEETHWWYRSVHELVLGVLGDRLHGGRARIFDAGCGTGRLLSLLSRFGEAGGVDLSPAAVEFCRRRGLERAAVGDLNELSLEPDSFDAITCIDVLYHEAIKDERELLGRFRAGLKPGGLLILDLPAFECLRRSHDRRVHGARRYRMPPLCGLLDEAGFEVETVSYRLPALFLFILLRKPFETGEGNARSDLGRVPGRLNGLLLGTSRLTNRLIRAGVRVPFGSSLFVAARKVGGPDA